MPSATALSSARSADRDDEFHYLSFRMRDEFFDNYRDRQPRWGFPMGGGNHLGEHAWIMQYARRKPGGGRERFWEGLRRVIEGMYSIQKDHALAHKLPWDEETAHRSAQEAYERSFAGKWSPPGRGLWMMGTEIVNGRRDSSALQNCSFISTENLPDQPTLPFTRLMDQSMLGVGVGFDTRGAGKLTISESVGEFPFDIPDSREGWCESLGLLLSAYLEGKGLPVFDYSLIRPAGSPIRGFGGIASGPGPLVKLHKQITKLFTGRAGQVLTSSDIVDICNMAGKCVVSANVRRSAEIALGFADDEDFLDIKNWEINPVRMGADGWGHLSNNSTISNTGDDLSKIARRIEINGEPGVFWLDVSQRYGRLIDPPDNREYRTRGVNPCLAGDTWIMTTNGPRQIKNLCDRPFWALVNGKAYRATAAWSSGIKETFRLNTVEGYEITLTEDHKVLRADGSWIAARDLVPDDEISLGNQRSVPFWDGPGSWTEGYLCGLYRGDGGIEDKTPVVKVWEKDEGSEGVAEEALRAALLVPGKRCSDWMGWRNYGRGCSVMSLYRPMVKKFGLLLRDKTLTAAVEQTSAAFHAGFLRGLFDADSHIQDDSDHGTSLQLTQSDHEALVIVQRMLQRLGIKSTIYKGKPEHDQLFPDGRGGQKVYTCKESWRLYITADSIPVFADVIGFSHMAKAEKLCKVLANRKRGFYAKPFCVRVKSLDVVGSQEVYDLTVDEIHTMDANGINVSNCAEQPLENMELCTLVETFPCNCTDLNDYLRTLKFAYLYGKTVTLLMTRWPETNEVMIRNRRIGTSMTGVVQFAEKHGWPDLKLWQDTGFKEIRKWDRIYSEWLGIRESIRVTTIKPSGTVSLLHGATPGVHWPRESGYCVRTIRSEKNNPITLALQEAGYPVEPSFTDPDTTVVISMPVEEPDIRAEHEVSVWEKVSLAVACQRYWSDNAVSVTATFSKDEAKDIPAILRAYDGQLKSISFLPMAEGVYRQAPFQRVSREKWEEMRSRIKPVNWDVLYDSADLPEAAGELYCSNDICEIPQSDRKKGSV